MKVAGYDCGFRSSWWSVVCLMGFSEFAGVTGCRCAAVSASARVCSGQDIAWSSLNITIGRSLSVLVVLGCFFVRSVVRVTGGDGLSFWCLVGLSADGVGLYVAPEVCS